MKYQDILERLNRYKKEDITLSESVITTNGKVTYRNICVKHKSVRHFDITKPQLDKLLALGYEYDYKVIER